MKRPFRTLFRDLVWLASAVPIAGCASMVIPAGDGAPLADAADAVDAVDSVVHDGGACGAHTSGSGGCGQTEVWPCGTPVTVPSLTIQTGTVCDTLCPDFVGQSFYSRTCEVSAADASGAVSVSCVFCRGGRRPEGWTLEPSALNGSPLGRFFAALAELEAASIPAFRALVKDLDAHGAPARLVDLARAAIADERGHTRLMGSIAKRFGTRPRNPRVKRRGVDSIEAIATLNAVEGCVGETFGALVATFQAQHAADADIRRAMAVIADDETRHADLAREIAAWADGLLDAAARERIALARRRALAALRDEIAIGVHDDLVAVAGMPNARQARMLFDGLAPEIEATFSN